MDTQIITEAQKRADQIAPRPSELPGGAAVHAAIGAWLIGMVFLLLDDLNVWVAIVTAVVLSALVAFADCRIKWERNSREYEAAVDYLKFMKEKSGV